MPEQAITLKEQPKKSKGSTRWIYLAIVIIIRCAVAAIPASTDSAPVAQAASPTATSVSSSKSVAVQNTNTADTTSDTYDQNSLAASIVNIMCGDSGGSGTIVDSSGMILTNNHIIPEDDAGNPTVDTCLVTLPDTQGKVKEIYVASPIVVPGLSQEYDLAFIKINGAYTDEDGTSYGTYPNVFPSYFASGCENDDVTLGEKIRVLGYPAISGGGYYLTITEGIVSSLPNDGTIVTSAKVDHGNSGGIAVDGKGCMVGIPSMISTDGDESLGVIMSNNVILEFMDKANQLASQQ